MIETANEVDLGLAQPAVQCVDLTERPSRLQTQMGEIAPLHKTVRSSRHAKEIDAIGMPLKSQWATTNAP